MRTFLVCTFLASVVASSALLTMTALGSDIPTRLIHRVEREINGRKTHPQLLPTPLPAVHARNSGLAALSERSLASHVNDAGRQRIFSASTPLDLPTAPAMVVFSETVTTAPVSVTLRVRDDQGNAIRKTVADLRSSANSPSVSATSTPVSVYLSPTTATTLKGFSHEWQTWNNCGPATLAMNLSYFGSALDQEDIGEILRQHKDDKNVNPAEMAHFARSQGFHAQVRVNGSSNLLKTLLTNGIPVLIETWLEEEPNDGMGHYRLLTGYNDFEEHWIAFDSYVSHDLIAVDGDYEGIRLDYAETDALWYVFNRTYLLIYPPHKELLVQSILGDQFDANLMWRQALSAAQDAAARYPTNPYVWFNLGSSLTELGDYANATVAFDHARQIGLPWRMLWYQFGPFKAYFEAGRYNEVLALAQATLANTKSIEEVYYWKGKALAATGDFSRAQQAWQQALKLNPNYQAAREAMAQR